MIAEDLSNTEARPSTVAHIQAGKQSNILLAFDGSAHALAALELVEDLFIHGPRPGDCPPPVITAMTVLPTQRLAGHEALQAALNQVEMRLKLASPGSKAILKAGNPAATINDYADEIEAGMIVMGAKGLRHTLGILLGGVAQQVAEYSKRPVLIVRAPYKGMKHILFATDGSSYSAKALNYLCSTESAAAASPGCCSWLPPESLLTAMYVLPPPLSLEAPAHVWTLGPEALYPAPLTPLDRKALDEEEERQGNKALEEVQSYLKIAGKTAETVLARGDAATELIQYAADHAVDLIICGTRGLSAVTGWLLGSVSRKLVHYAGCSVLIIK
jgi:nucleotide-binding universal stress UspA family protein